MEGMTSIIGVVIDHIASQRWLIRSDRNNVITEKVNIDKSGINNTFTI